MKEFLPISQEDINARGWEQIDFLFISGDAYVDHPSFGPAVICRVLEAQGYKVALLCQPDWRELKNFEALGKPRLAVLISGGNLDSMLCHYTAAKKPRKKDSYTPGGEMGKRPDHATVVYSQQIKRLWPEIPVIIGGIEASLRRFAHFDYWENKLLPSILVDSRADLLIYGMGEKQIVEIADYLAGGAAVDDIHYVRGTAYLTDNLKGLDEFVELPSLEDILKTGKLSLMHTVCKVKNWTHFQEKLLCRKMVRNLLFKIKCHFRCHRKKWMLCMTWTTCAPIILPMKNMAVCLP